MRSLILLSKENSKDPFKYQIGNIKAHSTLTPHDPNESKESVTEHIKNTK